MLGVHPHRYYIVFPRNPDNDFQGRQVWSMHDGHPTERLAPDLYRCDRDDRKNTLQRCAVRLRYRSDVERVPLQGANRHPHKIPPALLAR